VREMGEVYPFHYRRTQRGGPSLRVSEEGKHRQNLHPWTMEERPTIADSFPSNTNGFVVGDCFEG